MIFCEKAQRICDKSQYKEATLLEIIALRWHLLFCKLCSKYSVNNNTLSKLCNKANLHSLSEHQKECIKKEVSKNLPQE